MMDELLNSLKYIPHLEQELEQRKLGKVMGLGK
jgi:hypothetical protein